MAESVRSFECNSEGCQLVSISPTENDKKLLENAQLRNASPERESPAVPSGDFFQTSHQLGWGINPNHVPYVVPVGRDKATGSKRRKSKKPQKYVQQGKGKKTKQTGGTKRRKSLKSKSIGNGKAKKVVAKKGCSKQRRYK